MDSPDIRSPNHRSLTPWLILLLCVLALGLRVYVRYGEPNYLFYGTPETARPGSDAITWYLHSLNLIEGRGFGENIRQFPTRNFVPPGHPFLLGAIQMVVGSDPGRIGWVVALLSSLLPWITYLWVREMWGPRVGLWAAFLAAIHAPFMHIAFSVMSEPLAILSGSVAMLCAARAIRRQRLRDAVLAGLVFGAAALIRPAILAFLWGSVIALLACSQCPWRKRLVLLGLWIGMHFVPQTVWQFRNYQIHGVWSTIYSSISARHVWTAAHPEYAPYFYSRTSWHETMWRDPHASEIESIRTMQAEARAWIRDDPLKFAMGSIWRLHHLFLPNLQWRDVRIPYSQGGWGRFHLMWILCLAPLGAAIAWHTNTRMRRSSVGASAAPCISGSIWTLKLLIGTALLLIGAGVYGASARYRWPMEYFWIPLLAIVADRLAHLTREPLFQPPTYIVEYARPTGPVKWLSRLGLGAVGLFFLIYAAWLMDRYQRPPAPERDAPVITADQWESRMKERGLLDEWRSQSPQWIDYAEVFNEQAAHFGDVITYSNKLVVWWGILRLPIYDEGGFHSGYIILNPLPDPLGDARLDIIRHPDIAALPGDWKDGDIITCIARIEFRKRPIGRPNLYTYAILPGRVHAETATE